MHEYLSFNAERFPEKEALIFDDNRINYQTLNALASSFASSLQNKGLVKYQRVVVFLDNCPEIVIAMFGILKAGGVFIILNSSIKHQKLAYILNDSGSQFIIASTNRENIVEEAANIVKKELQVIWVEKEKIPETDYCISYSWKEFIKDGNKVAHQFPRMIGLDIAGLIYTSGSTGDPKGVISTHQNILNAARSIIQYLKNHENDIILNALPLSFDYGLYQVIMAMIFGGTVVLTQNFIFISDILQLIGKEKITGFPIVPMMLAMILNSTDLKKYDLSSLRYMTNTGAALPVEHIKKVRSLLPHVEIFSMFGLTECKRISYLEPDEIDQRPGSVGKAMPNCEVYLLDEKEHPVKPGEPGELVVRGPNVMKGYWNAPELTDKLYRKALGFDEKLLFTGDYFRMDDEGYLYFLGRKDDMIKSRGERLSAKEIENIIYQLEGIAECAVIGIPDEVIGQKIKAVIVRKENAIISSDEIIEYCKKNLEPYAVPEIIQFQESIPKTAHGKTDKLKMKNQQ